MRVGDFSHQDLLTTSQLETLGRLSGCISHRKMKQSCNTNSCYRSIDGTCNNLNKTMWGASYTTFQRLLEPEYENGFNLPKGYQRQIKFGKVIKLIAFSSIGWTFNKLYNGYPLPPARSVTNKIVTTESITPDHNYTHMLMQWGQFLE